MSGLEKRTILLNTLFNFGAVLVSLFISVYLYVYTNSIPIMCLQVICRIGMFPLFFSLAYRMSLKCRLGVTYTIGLVLITLSLIYALVIGERFAAPHPSFPGSGRCRAYAAFLHERMNGDLKK